MRVAQYLYVLVGTWLLVGQPALAQVSDRPFSGDTYWKSYYDRLCRELQLPIFDSTTRLFHFRLYTSSQIIDVGQRSDGVFTGFVYEWTRESVPSDEPETGRMYCLQQPIPADQIQEMLRSLNRSGMGTLPSQEYIAGWHTGLDGVTYILETTDGLQHRFRSYWTPQPTSPITEERQVYQFVDSALCLTDADKLNAVFQSTIPFYQSSNNTGSVRTRVITVRQYRAFKRERKRYRKAHKSNNT